MAAQIIDFETLKRARKVQAYRAEMREHAEWLEPGSEEHRLALMLAGMDERFIDMPDEPAVPQTPAAGFFKRARAILAAN